MPPEESAGPGTPSAAPTSGGDGVTLTYALPLGAGLGLTPAADCRTTARIPAPQNASAAVCCQNAAAGTPAAWPFELRLGDGETWVLAEAALPASGPEGSLLLTPLTNSTLGGLQTGAGFTGVRYAWQGYALCVVTNVHGLPGLPFVLEQKSSSQQRLGARR